MLIDKKYLAAWVVGLGFAGALHVPAPAQACSPPIEAFDVTFQTPAGTHTTRTPSFLLRGPTNYHATLEAADFSLTDSQGRQTPVEVEVMLHADFSSIYMVRVLTALEAGDYTLTYASEYLPRGQEMGSPTVSYVSELPFSVDPTAQHPRVLDIGLDWTRIRRGPGQPVEEDSCDRTNVEQSELIVTFPRTCHTQDFDLLYHIEYVNAAGEVVNASLRKVNEEDWSSSTESLLSMTARAQSRSSNDPTKNLSTCVRVTPYTTTGVQGATRELCSPTRCAEAIEFSDDLTYGDCAEASGVPTKIALPDPYAQASCQLSTGFETCEMVTCAQGSTCDQDVCVSDDPCEGVMCAPGEVCELGMCTLGTQPDACEQMTCGDQEICFEGKCYSEVTPDDDDDDDDDDDEDDDSCQASAVGGAGAPAPPWLALGLLGAFGAWRRRRS